MPQCGVFSLHFVFRDENHLAKSMLDPGVNALFIEMIAKNTTGARSLGLMTLGFRKFYSKNEIHSVADVKGRKVRVQATATEDRFFSAYGAIPVHMPIGQVYTSLETGLVDIAENGADIYRAQKHYEVAPVLLRFRPRGQQQPPLGQRQGMEQPQQSGAGLGDRVRSPMRAGWRCPRRLN